MHHSLFRLIDIFVLVGSRLFPMSRDQPKSSVRRVGRSRGWQRVRQVLSSPNLFEYRLRIQADVVVYGDEWFLDPPECTHDGPGIL